MVKIDLKGDVREFESGVTVAEVAKSLGMGLYKAACAGRLNGKAVDLRTPVTEDHSAYSGAGSQALVPRGGAGNRPGH